MCILRLRSIVMTKNKRLQVQSCVVFIMNEHFNIHNPWCIATFRLVYIGVIFFSQEFIITCIFIYVRVCLFLYSAHWTLSLKGQIQSYLRLRDLFKNKPRRIVNLSMTVFTSLVENCHKYICTWHLCKPIEMLGLDNMQNKMRTHISYK
jgi:hypothetical protein